MKHLNYDDPIHISSLTGVGLLLLKMTDYWDLIISSMSSCLSKFRLGPVSSDRRRVVMYVICLICPSISTSCGTKVSNVGTMHTNVSTRFFHNCFAYCWQHWFLPVFLYYCQWLWRWMTVTRSAESFIFSHTFRVLKLKFNVKPFKLNILTLL